MYFEIISYGEQNITMTFKVKGQGCTADTLKSLFG